MPIELPTNFGKVDYNVVLSLQRLAEGVNRLEAQVTSQRGTTGSAEGLQSIRTDLRRLTERVDALSRAVEMLQNP